ncbi:hypothetical protein LMG29542_06454 [Paraburkholderia humisilvae]|uniref:TrbL/VirB6 plasmid conjugal transfer protein n=2 Tax=Paraburkholderia humisilvae TaxID=627669 RepID=A0A6J5EW41_9BURK|nr:hypothetical protein LMG29542_06454 [Paraburkholderia humisilvae]
MASWNTFLWVLDRDTADYMVRLFRLGVRSMVMLAMLLGWSGVVHHYFVGNMDEMAQRIASGKSDVSQLVKALESAGKIVLNADRQRAVQTCEQVPNTTPEGLVIPGTHQECGTAQPDSGSGALGSLSRIGNFVATLPIALDMFLLKGLCFIAMIAMALAFLVIAQLGTFLLDVAFIIGPVLIPWFVLPAGEFLFDGWLRSTITAGLYKVIAWAFLVIILKGAIPQIQKFSDTLAQTGNTSAQAYFDANYLPLIGLTLLCAIGAFIMWQVPKIAAGYAGGKSGDAGGAVKKIVTLGGLLK